LLSLSDYRTLISVPLQSLTISQVTLDGACVERSREGGACPVGKNKPVCTLDLGIDLKHEYMVVPPEIVTRTEEGAK